MPLLEVEVEAPRAVNLDIKFGNGKAVTVKGGTKTKAMLTGDEVGYVQAQIEAARKQARREGARDSDVDGGGLTVLTPGYEEVPVGSKKHRAMHPEEYTDEAIAARTAQTQRGVGHGRDRDRATTGPGDVDALATADQQHGVTVDTDTLAAADEPHGIITGDADTLATDPSSRKNRADARREAGKRK